MRIFYSGRTGRLLHRWEGALAGDRLGSAVAGAGDQNLDGYDDVLVGAEGADAAGINAGAAYVLSGRDCPVLRRLDGRAPGDAFGSGVDWVEGIIRRDLVVGAQNANGGGGGASVFAGFTGAQSIRSLRPRVPRTSGSSSSRASGTSTATSCRTSTPPSFGAWAATGSPACTPARRVDDPRLAGWPGDGRGPGREAGDVDRDGRIDLAVGAYSRGATGAGRIDIFSGATGRVLRTITSTTAGENLGFDAVGADQVVDHNGRPDLLLSAAEGDTVYLVAGRTPPRNLKQP